MSVKHKTSLWCSNMQFPLSGITFTTVFLVLSPIRRILALFPTMSYEVLVMYLKMLLQISFGFELLLAHITSENFVWMYLLVLLQGFLGCVWTVFTVLLFIEKFAQVRMDFVMILKLVIVPEDLLIHTAWVLKSQVKHHMLVSTTVTFEVLTTVSAVESLIMMLLNHILVNIFVCCLISLSTSKTSSFVVSSFFLANQQWSQKQLPVM